MGGGGSGMYANAEDKVEIVLQYSPRHLSAREKKVKLLCNESGVGVPSGLPSLIPGFHRVISY